VAVPVSPDERLTVPPTQAPPEFPGTTPIVLIVTVVVALAVQPVPGYVTVKLYTPPAADVVAVKDGATLVELNPFGPLQLYAGLPVPLTPVALRLTVVPVHKGFGDALILAIVGAAFTAITALPVIVFVHRVVLSCATTV
jgi:hypothetical protein